MLLETRMMDAKVEGIRIGKEEGIRIGEERGIRVGEERGIRVGEERGIRVGEERGIRFGKEEGIITVALKMLEKGMPIAEVADLAGLPIEKVTELRKQTLS